MPKTAGNYGAMAMTNDEYDVITVGGELGGAALARVPAEKDLRVLVTERERQFKDRIRGEFMAPSGVAEAQQLGLYEFLLETCAPEQPFHLVAGLGPVRDFRITIPQKLPAFTFYHPAMPEVVVDAARAAGAEVWRGADLRNIQFGQQSAVTVESDGAVRELSARMVVCADGRSSMGGSWGGLETRCGEQCMLAAGLMSRMCRSRMTAISSSSFRESSAPRSSSRKVADVSGFTSVMGHTK
jgi:flavin-dependent dehydrogenase